MRVKGGHSKCKAFNQYLQGNMHAKHRSWDGTKLPNTARSVNMAPRKRSYLLFTT